MTTRTDYRSASGRYWDWGAIVRSARAHPNQWVVRLPNERASLVQTIRQRTSPELRLSDGELEARAIHIYLDDYGRRRANIYIRFVPSVEGS